MLSPKCFEASVVLFLGLNYLCHSATIDYNNPVAQTNYGQIRGKPYSYATTGSGIPRQVVEFIGVPYARPPTGYDRFMASRPPDPWTGEVKDCTNNRVMCPQVDQRFNFQLSNPITESEDCLYLNIYVPVSSNLFSTNLPVLVYFHGGEFKYGGKDFYKPDYLLENSIVGTNPGMIIITVNYRLGVLGFLSADDINIPGNNGIRDQVQALRWINQNIGAFNGNAGNVTIMGHDAGAISVSMHVLNQESWPYFSAAISIGGTVFTPWAFKDNPKDQALNFGSFFGCDLSTGKMLDCLRNQDVNALMGKSRDRDYDRNFEPYWFRPVVDRNQSSVAILKDYPLPLYQSGQYKHCPYIVGFTKDEGSLEFYLQYDRLINRRSIEEKIAYLIRPFLKDWVDEEIIASAIKYQYFSRNSSRSSINTQYGNAPTNPRLNPGLLNNVRNINAPYQTQQLNYDSSSKGYAEQEQDRVLVEMLGDFLYIAPADHVARLHSSLGGQAWMFAFEYQGSKSFGAIQKNTGQVSKNTYGVSHMDDLFFIMPNEYVPDSTTIGNERSVANTYTNTISLLARVGTIPVYGSAYGWQQYTPQNPNYLRWPNNAVTPAATVATQPQNGYRTAYADFFNGFIFEIQEKSRRYPTPFPYREHEAYKAATWSLFGFILLLILVLVAIVAVLCMKRKKNNELKLLRKNDRELEERGTESEKL